MSKQMIQQLSSNLLVLSVLLAPMPIFAETISPLEDGNECSDCVAIKAGKIYPVDSAPVEDRALVLQGTRIKDIVKPDNIPEGAETISYPDGVITPGFIDGHTRLGTIEIGAVSQTRDFRRGGKQKNHAAFKVADGFHTDSTVIPFVRRQGITSVVTVPTGGIVAGQSAWADLAGFQSSGAASLIDDSVGMYANYQAIGGKLKGLRSRAAIMEYLRELFDDAAYFDSHTAAYNTNRSRDLRGSRLDLKALQPVRQGQMPMIFKTHRASDIRRIVSFAEERDIDVAIAGGAEAWKVKDLLADQKVPVIAQPLKNLPSSFDTLDARLDNTKLLDEAGVPVIISSFATHRASILRQVAGNAVGHGLPHSKALEAVTRRPAELFGQGDSHGALSKGYLANFVVWSGDPFELSSQTEAVYVRGQKSSLQTRHKMLFERYR